MRSRLQDNVVDPKNPTLEIRSIGVSNYGTRHLLELLEWNGLKVKPVVNQLELHPWLPRVEIAKYCLDKIIRLEAYAAVSRGEKFGEFAIVGLSKKYNLTPAQALLTWSHLKGFVVLAKTVTPSRITLSDKAEDTEERDADILKTLDYPSSYELITWDGWDPTTYNP